MLNQYKSCSFSSSFCVSKHLFQLFLVLSSGCSLICLPLFCHDLGNSRHSIPSVSSLSTSEECLLLNAYAVGSCSLIFCCCSYFYSCHHSYISVITICIYIYIFKSKHAYTYWIHGIEFRLEIISVTVFWSFLWSTFSSFCSIIHWKKLRWDSGKPHKAILKGQFWLNIF